MKILLIEDIEEKRDAIQATIQEEVNGTTNDAVFSYAKNLQEARRHLLQNHYDLVIFDMYLPQSESDEIESDCSDELIREFSASKNYQSEAIALTRFDISETHDIKAFNLAGITLVYFDDSDNWKVALQQKVARASQKFTCDFLVFCALPKERSAFQSEVDTIEYPININGMDCQEVTIDSSKGLIIKPRAMGLVNMAIVTSKAIELFQPKIVAMSGICAGVKGESKYLDIVVGKTCWEWQTGKWSDGEFKQEPYQSSLPRSLEVDLQQSSENDSILDSVRQGLYNTELQNMKIRVSPISSGSAVVADEEMMKKIGLQQRKMSGLEMEMYSLYEAAEQSQCRPLYFGAKTVVDLGDSSKADDYHDVGCQTSARYVVLMLREQLKKLSKQ